MENATAADHEPRNHYAWKAVALALLSALLAGAGAVVVNGRSGAVLGERVTAAEEKIRAQDHRQTSFDSWLTRVEGKLDRVIENRRAR